MAAGVFFDGLTAARRQVAVRIEPGRLVLSEAGRPDLRWPVASLRELEALPGQLKLKTAEGPDLANLVIADPAAIAAIRRLAPSIQPDAVRLRTPAWKIVSLSLAAAGSIAGMIVFVVPLLAALLAPLVPAAVERRLGDQVSAQVREMFDAGVCASPAGSAALGKLSARLGGGVETRHPIRIDVLKTAQKNAIALPGGQVFLFDGLLQAAENVDEIAGVLGHEIGHEAAHDGLQGVIRAGGTAFLLGLLFGDVGGSWAALMVTRQLIESAHSRDAESRADAFGQRIMHHHGRPASHMARLLVRMSGEEKGRGSLFASHPLSRDRLEALQKADLAAGRPLDGPPLLTAGEWRALRDICKDD